MISTLAFIFVFGILVFIHELGHFLAAKKNGVRVEKFSFGFGPKLWGKKKGDTEYLISAIPLGGYIKMAGDEPGKECKGKPWEYLSKNCGQRAQIVAAGPILNYFLAFFLFSFIFVMGAPVLTTKVGEVLEDSPAKKAGIKKDDIILAVNGEDVGEWQKMAEIIQQKTKRERLLLNIKRDDEILKIGLVPEVKETTDIFGQKTSVGLIGIASGGDAVSIKYGWGKSFYKGGEKLFTLTGFTYKALWFMITRRLSFRESITGPVGIFYFTGKAAELGFVYLLNLMGLLSMSLAIFNFLPFPVLDGGHIFFLLLEKIRRKPLSARTQTIAAQVGMVFLFALMAFAVYNDLMRFGIWEKVAEWWKGMGPK